MYFVPNLGVHLPIPSGTRYKGLERYKLIKMLNNDNEEKKIVFNTPKNLNISESFPEFSRKDLPKIECLINQINYFNSSRGYQVHIVNHAWSYCLSNGEVGLILKRLVQLNIIQKVNDGTPGVDSNSYKMVTPYSNEDSNKSYYSADDYLFLRKLQADKWLAKGAKHSSYVKQSPIPKVNSSDYIKQLEDLLTANGIAIPDAPEEDMNKIEKATKHLATLKKATDSTKSKDIKALGLGNGLNMTVGHSKQITPTPAPQVKGVVQPVVTAAPVNKTSGTFIPVEGSRGYAMLNNDAFIKEVSPLSLKETYELNRTVMIKFKQEFEGDFNIELRNEIVTFRCFHSEKSVEYIKCSIKNLIYK